MVQVTEQDSELNAVCDWLEKAARQHGLDRRMSATFLRKEGDYLHFAVRLQDAGDSYDRARVLIEIEDDWDTEHPNSKSHLWLIPTAA